MYLLEHPDVMNEVECKVREFYQLEGAKSKDLALEDPKDME